LEVNNTPAAKVTLKIEAKAPPLIEIKGKARDSIATRACPNNSTLLDRQMFGRW
jgi:hypothetical protein